MTKTQKPKKADSYHHGDLKKALIQAALKILASEGSRGMTLRQVAKKAGVSHAAPYAHFKHKEALLAEVAEEGFRLFSEALEAAASKKLPPWESFLKIGEAYIDFSRKHPAHFDLIFSDAVPICDDYPDLKRESERSFGVLMGAVARCREAHLLLKAPDEFFALTAWS
ncbi:MAG: TetR/AcrR family transcriptional regulator, partial [Spirochaetia bacterium]|nr:TetR/AcrR family transcriptional regulator [Spirochaetia bacterium]